MTWIDAVRFGVAVVMTVKVVQYRREIARLREAMEMMRAVNGRGR